MGKRIVICATQVPFVRGGAEYLVEGLQKSLIAHGHTVDIVQLPFAWQPPERIIDHALAWRLLDLTKVNNLLIDQVICTKFPSYLVRHPCKVVWLVHQHRQAYDWYGTAMSDFVNIPRYKKIRQLIMQMDKRGLGEAQALYTISKNVSQRLQRFNGLESKPLYPPSHLAEKLWVGAYGDYILSPSRLDKAKRLDLLLEAVALTNNRVRVVIVGEGEERKRLETLANRLKIAQRVEFTGFVTDQTLIDLYTNARAVYYAPLDEDYGFATVEALAAGRPVITTNDAGGVLEFVEHGFNGYVVQPQPSAIAPCLEQVMSNLNLTASLGKTGLSCVRHISWERVVHELVK